MMKCGHASNMKDKHGNVICGICNCKEVLGECNDDALKGRRAICNQHKNGVPTPVPSSWQLPFFKYRPEAEYDTYYCGCYGWE